MGTAITAYKKKMAAKAKTYASEEKTSSSSISIKGGVLSYNEEELPGNEMIVIILDAIHENTFFPERFDPEVSLPPKCFAFGRTEEEMQPHENVPDDDPDSYFELQSEFCDECPNSEWGSADVGRGKACANRRRLAVIPAGRIIPAKKKRDSGEMEVFDEPEQFRDADIAFLKLPVTSTKNWSKYVHMLTKDHQMPPFGVITHVWIEPDEKTSFKVCFDLIEVLEEEDILEVLFARHEDAQKVIEQPYTEPSEEDLEKPKSRAKTGLRGLKKKKGKKSR